MSISSKRKISVHKWTPFWKDMGIHVQKRTRTLKGYKPKSDITALKKAGVDPIVSAKIYHKSLSYTDKLLFKHFSRFFRKDTSTVIEWLKARNSSDAFSKLWNILNKDDLDATKKKFSELSTIFEFYKKGEGQLYSGKLGRNLSINAFPVTTFLRKLNRSDPRAKYKHKNVAVLGKKIIIWFEKHGDKKTHKFIILSREYSALRVILSLDSRKEYGIVKRQIQKHFNTFLDTPTERSSFRRLESFLETGRSRHFTLSGASYVQSGLRYSIASPLNRAQNITTSSVYKKQLTNVERKIEALSQFRLHVSSSYIKKPIFISILTYKEGILGAILLNLDDKRLSSVQRTKLHEDFFRDFGLHMNQFLVHKDLTTKALYKHFLQTNELAPSKLELRSNEAMKVYKSLVANQILSVTSTDETSMLCVNNLCINYFLPVWDNKKYCNHCGEFLINGRSVETRKLNEMEVSKYIENAFTSGNSVSLSKKVLSRSITMSQIIYKGMSSEIIPLTSSLNEDQLLILKFRFPHCILITSKNDQSELEDQFQTLDLWKLAYSLDHDNGKLLQDAIQKSTEDSLHTTRSLFRQSIKRITNSAFYRGKNKKVRNLGAELFEADNSVILDYILGNCIWLGASHRGVSLPDGMTAFPMLNTSKGCFIWDSKFSEGSNLAMGNFAKNKKYINDAKSNKSIRTNGGLKGFVFVSNNTFPKHFITKYKPLVKNRRLKVSFLRASHLEKIAKHYRQHERLISNNTDAKNKFIDSMVDLLYTTKNDRRCEIISDAQIDNLTSTNNIYFKTLKKGRLLQP